MLLVFILFESRERERESLHLLIDSGSYEGEPSLDLPHWWQGSKYLACHLLVDRVCIRKKMESEAKLGLDLKHSDARCHNHRGVLSAAPDTCPHTCVSTSLQNGCFHNCRFLGTQTWIFLVWTLYTLITTIIID